MKYFTRLFLLFSLTILSSFTSNDIVNKRVKITRFLIAHSGSQIIEYENGNLIKIITKRHPIIYKMNSSQNNQILKEFENIDRYELAKELENLPLLNKIEYPRMYYKFIVDNDTIVTKEFSQKSMPNQLKKIDKLMISYSSLNY